MKKTILPLLAVLSLSLPAFAEGDAEAGKKIFRKCAACHTVEPGKRKPGPHLQGIVGRDAGIVEGFKYSKPMINSAITWDAATLAEFLTDPKETVKGTKMSFRGIKDSDDMADLIAYLEGL
ncbi:cytochrome c family protein [uncultured Roseobacter sp.]|uniref:c-type cytochrome n=1 Tax=uncultured Roseobacter sp. TaxID=114847 RepID=UPI002606EDA9|nr:cytochrome c family protein [uncultured Roseobacter sp.]